MKRSVPLFLALLVVCLFAPAAAQQSDTARRFVVLAFLISNDDGVHAPGLAALAQALKALGDVIIVAPSEVQSGKSRMLSSRSIRCFART